MSDFTQLTPFASVQDGFVPVLVDATVKACIIFLLAGLTAIMLSRSSAAVRHLVWGVAFLAFLLLPIVSNTVPKWRVLPRWLGTGDVTSRGEGFGMRSAHPQGSSNQPNAGPRDLSQQLVAAPAKLEIVSTKSIAASSAEQPVTTSRIRDLLPPSRVVFAVWSIGLGLLLLRTGCSRFILRHVLLSADPVKDGPIGDEISRAPPAWNKAPGECLPEFATGHTDDLGAAAHLSAPTGRRTELGTSATPRRGVARTRACKALRHHQPRVDTDHLRHLLVPPICLVGGAAAAGRT